MRPNGAHLVILTLAATLSCLSGDGAATNDSPSDREDGALTVSPHPDVVIGTTTGTDSEALSSITDADLLTNGIVVLDGQDVTIHVYDLAGRRIRSFGRPGEGPGELKRPHAIETCDNGTTISVWDTGTNRLVRFDQQGVEQGRVVLPAGGALLACHEDHLISARLTGVIRLPTADETSWPLSGTVEELAADGAARTLIADTVLAENRPLGPISALTFVDSLLLFGAATTDGVALIPLDGGRPRRLMLGLTRRAATPTEYEAAIEALARQMIVPQEQEMVRDILHRVPSPDSLPLFRSMVGTNQGQLWITTSALGSERTTVVVMDVSQSRVVGTVHLPRDADLLAVREGRLLLRHPDSATGGSVLESYRYTHTTP